MKRENTGGRGQEDDKILRSSKKRHQHSYQSHQYPQKPKTHQYHQPQRSHLPFQNSRHNLYFTPQRRLDTLDLGGHCNATLDLTQDITKRTSLPLGPILLLAVGRWHAACRSSQLRSTSNRHRHFFCFLQRVLLRKALDDKTPKRNDTPCLGYPMPRS